MSLRTINIALLDDHSLFREGVELIITTNNNYKIKHSGESASKLLELLRKGFSIPDVVIVDNEMPQMTGMEFTSIISKEFPTIKVIILSMHVSNQLLMEAFENNAKAYVDKSSGSRELLKAIENVIYNNLYLPPNLQTIFKDLKIQESSKSKTLQYVIHGAKYSEDDIEIIRSVFNGKENKVIAKEMNKSIRTIESKRARILAKSNCSNTLELFQFAIKNKLVLIS